MNYQFSTKCPSAIFTLAATVSFHVVVTDRPKQHLTSCIFHHSINHKYYYYQEQLRTRDLPERDTTDASKLQFPFQHLLYLSFLRSFLHLLSSNQIDALRGQDQISLDGLRKKQK